MTISRVDPLNAIAFEVARPEGALLSGGASLFRDHFRAEPPVAFSASPPREQPAPSAPQSARSESPSRPEASSPDKPKPAESQRSPSQDQKSEASSPQGDRQQQQAHSQSSEVEAAGSPSRTEDLPADGTLQSAGGEPVTVDIEPAENAADDEPSLAVQETPPLTVALADPHAAEGAVEDVVEATEVVVTEAHAEAGTALEAPTETLPTSEHAIALEVTSLDTASTAAAVSDDHVTGAAVDVGGEVHASDAKPPTITTSASDGLAAHPLNDESVNVAPVKPPVAAAAGEAAGEPLVEAPIAIPADGDTTSKTSSLSAATAQAVSSRRKPVAAAGEEAAGTEGESAQIEGKAEPDRSPADSRVSRRASNARGEPAVAAATTAGQATPAKVVAPSQVANASIIAANAPAAAVAPASETPVDTPGSGPADSTAPPAGVERPSASRFAEKLLSSGTSRREGTGEMRHVDHARFVQRVAGALARAQQRDGEIRLRLSPAELGSIRVNMKMEDGALTARLEAETSAARGLLLEHLPTLRERLAEQNIRIERFEVDVQQQPQSDAGQGQGQQSHRQEGESHHGRVGRVSPANGAAATAKRETEHVVSEKQINIVV